MSNGSIPTRQACLERADEFKVDGDTFAGMDNEWYAVAYFYAAYHLVRGALLADPVFQDLKRLQSFDASFVPGDKLNTHHKGRKKRGPGEWQGPGVSDLVVKLYNDISIEYARLHSASIAVRYSVGLMAYDKAALIADFTAIKVASDAGAIVAPTLD